MSEMAIYRQLLCVVWLSDQPALDFSGLPLQQFNSHADWLGAIEQVVSRGFSRGENVHRYKEVLVGKTLKIFLWHDNLVELPLEAAEKLKR